MKKKLLLFAVMALHASMVLAQGKAGSGIDAGTQELKQSFDAVSKLIMAIGGIVGLVGGVRVFIKWNNGDQDVQKAVMGWLGSCVFLIVVGIVIRAFFVTGQ